MGFFDKLFSQKEEPKANQIFAPINGQVVDIAEVPDPTFSEKLMGNGIAIIPADGMVYAPCDGTIDTMFHTGHAVSMTSNTGVELLIHVGLETVNLEGKPFKIYVKNGEKVKQGQLMIEADLDMIKAAGLNTITPVIICNSDDYSSFNATIGQAVTKADVVINLEK